MTTTTADLWHRAGACARDQRKRSFALYGVTLTPPGLVLAAMLHRAVSGEGLDLGALRRPLAYVLDPLRTAWMHDEPLSVLLAVLLFALALALVWGLFGGAITRMAAVELTTGRREAPRDALAFARRHAGGFVGAKATLWSGALLPFAGAILLALAGRLEGVLGGILFPVAVVVGAALVIGAIVAGSLGTVAGFLSSPTIACEDSDAFDAVSRTYAYAAAGLPRLLGVRLVFFAGVLLGTLWRGLRTAATLALGALAIQAGAGRERVDGMLAALAEVGGVGRAAPWRDAVPALLLALLAGGLVAVWLADLVVRVLTARVGAYLVLRRAVDRVATTQLRTAPAATGRLDAEQAGFVEVSRIGVPTRRPTRETP